MEPNYICPHCHKDTREKPRQKSLIVPISILITALIILGIYLAIKQG